jgi:hypothetical protein
MPIETPALTSLPGPRRFFGRISAVTGEGRNVLVVVPSYAVESGLALEIRRGIEHMRCVHAALDKELLLSCKGSIPEAAALAADFMEPLSALDTTNRWKAYLNHDESAGKIILVIGWDVDGLDEDASYWLRLVHSSSLDPESQPRFVFLVRDTDLNVEALAKEHSPHLSVLWWWDVIGTLDSELCAELALSDQPVSALRRAMLAESLAWEIQLAEPCARMWGAGDPPSLLRKAFDENADGSAFTLRAAELDAVRNSGTTVSPPPTLRPAWNAGRLDSWEGRIELSTNYEDFHPVLERRFWSAQVRILMPLLEGQRQRFAQRFEKLASEVDIAEISGKSGLLELGRMLNGHHRRYVDFGAEEEELLKILVMTRNKIAHHESLDDDLYAAVVAIGR